jgi:hypothetical protein
MVELLFTEKEGVAGTLIDLAGGGVSTLAGLYVWEKLAQPVNKLLGKWLGLWAQPITAFVIGLIVLHIARSQEGTLGRFLQLMAYGMLGGATAKALNIDPPLTPTNPTGNKVAVSPWSTLRPTPIVPQ